MAGNFKFIPEISPTEKNWQAKLIVVEKFSPKQARHSSSRYQNMVLMDLQGNIVHTTLYDSNIIAFEDQLQLSKTYIVSNALVKDTKPEYRASNGNVQWIISGKTRIEEVNENHMEFLFSTFSFTPFPELEKHMDSNNDISILAVAIDIRPKRLIQTRFGNQTYVQDIFLIDRTFHTIILTMWDGFVEKECIVIAESIAKKPIILANRLKVSSFNGLTLSTKINSTFFINAGFNEVAEVRKCKTHPSNAALSLMNTEAEYIFYVKVTQLQQNTTQYRYEIIFVLNALPTIMDAMEYQTTKKNTSFLNFTEENKNSETEETSTPSAKRALFGTTAKPVNPMVPDMETEKDNAISASTTH